MKERLDNSTQQHSCYRTSSRSQSTSATVAKSELLKESVFNATLFSGLCAFFCLIFSFHWQGAIYGATFGMLFGTLCFWTTRTLTRHLGDVFGSTLLYGFAGTASGALAGGLTKVICTPIASIVLDAIYGNTIGEPERAFYAIVYAGFLGGFFGLAQALFFDGSRAVDAAEGKPIVIKTELEEKKPSVEPTPPKKTTPSLKPRYRVPKELVRESFFSDN